MGTEIFRLHVLGFGCRGKDSMSLIGLVTAQVLALSNPLIDSFGLQ